jgi:sugar lactone lactonase YvrE
MAMDGTGNIYFADQQYAVIYKMTPAGTITAVVGNATCWDGNMAYTGAGTATSLGINGVAGMAADAQGNLYFTRFNERRILKLNTAGQLSLVAGTNLPGQGYSGDGGPAVQAGFDGILGLACDAAGNVYVSDMRRVRKIDTAGVITTIAGSGLNGPGSNDDGGPALQANVMPVAITVDATGNVYFAESYFARVRKIDTAGIINTVAGTGIMGYNGNGGPATAAEISNAPALSTDAAGNLYLLDASRSVVRKVDAGGIINTIAGDGSVGYSGDGGPALNAMMNSPMGMVSDAAGNIYVADYKNLRVRKVDAGGIITTVAGNGRGNYNGDSQPAIGSQFGGGRCKAALNGDIYLADSSNHRIVMITGAGQLVTIAGTGKPGFSGDGGAAADAELNTPSDLVLGPQGGIIFTDRKNNRVRMINAIGKISTIAGTGAAMDFGEGWPANQAGMDAPSCLERDLDSNFLYVVTSNSTIRKIDLTTKNVVTVAGGAAGGIRLGKISDLASDTSGNLFILEPYLVRKMDRAGHIINFAGIGYSGNTGMGGPAVAARISPSTVLPDNNGNVYITDNGRSGILKVDATGIIRQVAGQPDEQGFNGEISPLHQALYYDVSDLFSDQMGRLYLRDNNRIRKIQGTPNSVTTMPSATVNFSLYPNPNTGRFVIEGGIANDSKPYLLDIYNMLGQKVYQEMIQSSGGRLNHTLELEGRFPPGAYLLRLTGTGNTALRFTITQ